MVRIRLFRSSTGWPPHRHEGVGHRELGLGIMESEPRAPLPTPYSLLPFPRFFDIRRAPTASVSTYAGLSASCGGLGMLAVNACSIHAVGAPREPAFEPTFARTQLPRGRRL